MGRIIRNLFKEPENSFKDALSDILKQGARRLLIEAVHTEVESYIEASREQLDQAGRRMVVRNGYHQERTIQTGIGPIDVQMPRVRDRRCDEYGRPIRFNSKILPPYLCQTKRLEEFIPWLYLRGVSSGDFSGALEKLLGESASGFSASTVIRLKEKWAKEHETWERRDLQRKQYVYFWADGVHFNIRLGEQGKACMLVVIGATEDGKKELVAVKPGIRESELSWSELLVDLRDRGLYAPRLCVADGALGFWRALDKVFPESAQQLCWVHKTANVLDKLPKSRQPQAKAMIHEMYNSDTKRDAERALERFVEVFEPKWPRAVASIIRNRERMFNFYDFPAQHWQHIRSTNVIESAFATVRLRSNKTKGCGSAEATSMMVFKLLETAQGRWRRLRGHELLADVLDINVRFENGVRKDAA